MNPLKSDIFQILGVTVTSQNCIHEEVKIRLALGNPC